MILNLSVCGHGGVYGEQHSGNCDDNLMEKMEDVAEVVLEVVAKIAEFTFVLGSNLDTFMKSSKCISYKSQAQSLSNRAC